MRPTPAETIAGVRRILRDVVEPEVTSEYARSRLREVRAVLAQIDWDDAALRVRRDRDAQLSLLATVREWIDADPARAAALPPPDPVADGPGPETLAELTAAHRAEAALLVAATDVLWSWTCAHPDDGPAHALRLRVVRHLAGEPR